MDILEVITWREKIRRGYVQKDVKNKMRKIKWLVYRDE